MVAGFSVDSAVELALATLAPLRLSLKNVSCTTVSILAAGEQMMVPTSEFVLERVAGRFAGGGGEDSSARLPNSILSGSSVTGVSGSGENASPNAPKDSSIASPGRWLIAAAVRSPRALLRGWKRETVIGLGVKKRPKRRGVTEGLRRSFRRDDLGGDGRKLTGEEDGGCDASAGGGMLVLLEGKPSRPRLSAMAEIGRGSSPVGSEIGDEVSAIS